MTTLISITLAAVCLIFAEPLMSLFGASDQTLAMAVEYFRIVVIFFPFYLLLNVTNSMIRADGSPTYAMIAMLTGAVTNIALRGATFVTQISIVVVSLVCNMTLAHYGDLSKYGRDIPISVFSIQAKVYTVVCNIVTGIVLGGQPIFGYNYGARNFARVRQAYKLVLLSSLAVGLGAVVLFELWPEGIIAIFGSGNELYQEFAVKTFRIYMSLTMITCLVKMTAVFFQSIGRPGRAILASLIRDILCFTPLALILPAAMEKSQAGMGIDGLLYAAPVSDLIALGAILALTIPFFRQLKKQEQ